MGSKFPLKRRRKNTNNSAGSNYQVLEDRRLLAVIGSIDGAGLLTISLTADNDSATIGIIGNDVSLNASIDLDPSTAGVQSATFQAVRTINIVGDELRTNQSVVFGGNFLNSNTAALNGISVTGVVSAVFTGNYQLAQNLSIALKATESGGQISDGATGQVIVNGTSALNSFDNQINFDNANNDFVGAVSLNAGGIFRSASISDLNDLNFSGINVTGDLTVVAVGNVTDNVGTSIFVELTGSFSAANVTLGDDIIDVTEFTQVGFTVSGDVDLTQDSIVRLATTSANNLRVRSSAGIFDRQSSVITVTDLATFDGARVRLGDNGTDRFNAGRVTFNSTGHVNITEDSAMQIAGTNTALNAHLFSLGALTNSAGASITVTNNLGLDADSIDLGNAVDDQLSAGAFYFFAPGVVSLNANSNIHLVQVNNEAAQLILTTTGVITDDLTAELLVSGNSSFNAASVNLGETLTDSFNSGTITFATTDQFKITENSDLIIAGSSTAGNSIINSSDQLTNANEATMTVTNNAAFYGNTSINLGTRIGDVFNFGSLTINSPGDVVVSENSDTQFAGLSQVDSLILTSLGDISDQINALTTIDTGARFAGLSVVLGDHPTTDIFNAGLISFDSPGQVDITEVSGILLFGTNQANSLTLIANGNVSDTPTAQTTVNTLLNVSGALINLGTDAADFLSFQSLTFNSTANTNLAVNSGVQLVGNSQAGDRLILSSTGNITDQDVAQTRVQNFATFTGIDIIIGELATDCFDILTGGIEKVTINGSGVTNVVEANC